MELMSAEEAAKYLKISVKNLYHIAKQGGIPATRIGNKWIFSRSIIDDWICQSAQHNVERDTSNGDNTLISAGSNDFIWEILSNKLFQSPHEIFLPYASIGSMEGLKALKNKQAHSASIHLLDPNSETYNIPFLSKFLKEEKVTVVHLFNRRQGLMVQNGNPAQIVSLQDLTKPGVTFINRQEGSGTRVLLDMFLNKQGISPGSIRGYNIEVSTHREVAMAVISGMADAGMGVESAAVMAGLDFIELQEESYDIVFRNEIISSMQAQVFIDTISSNSFKNSMKSIKGYNLENAGNIIWEGSVA